MNQTPQTDFSAIPATRPERRRYVRHRCTLPVEIRTPGASFPTQGQTIDVSLGGCYVNSRFNLAVGTEVDLKLWVDGVALKLKAVVRTSDPGVGHGFQFTNLDEAGGQVLNDYFRRQDAEPSQDDPGSTLRDLLII